MSRNSVHGTDGLVDGLAGLLFRLWLALRPWVDGLRPAHGPLTSTVPLLA